MHGVDDLGVVDPAQVHGRDPEIGVPQLTLDDQQRHAFSGHFDRMRVPELMVRREPPADAGRGGGMVQLHPDPGG
jgi:hypothetical protein